MHAARATGPALDLSDRLTNDRSAGDSLGTSGSRNSLRTKNSWQCALVSQNSGFTARKHGFRAHAVLQSRDTASASATCPWQELRKWKRRSMRHAPRSRPGRRLPAPSAAAILRRAADILRARNDELAGSRRATPASRSRRRMVVDVLSGADCIEYFAALAADARGRAHRPRAAGLRLHAPRAARRRRRHRGVELPAADRLLEVGPGARLRQCDDLQAGELTPLTAVELAEAYRDAGLPDGRLQRRAGSTAATGRLLIAPSRDSQGVADRRGRHRQGRHGRCRDDAQARDARARRQVAAHRLRRCRSSTMPSSGALLANFYSAGEVCSNGTRVFVQRRCVRPASSSRLAARVSSRCASATRSIPRRMSAR